MVRLIKKSAAPIAALVMGTTMSGCAYMGDWDEVSGVALSEFDTSGDAPTTIQLAGPDKIEITSGEGLDITLAGDRDAGDALRFDRDGNKLTIARDRKVYDGSSKAIVQLTMPPAVNLEIAGSGTIAADTMASDAEIEIAGSGEVTVATIESDRLAVEIAGSGEVTGSGTAESVSVGIAGSGDVRLADLNAETVSVKIAGSGDVEISSDGSVSADIAGSGDVLVIGSATCSVNAAGSGSLTCRPATAAAADAGTEEEADAE